MIEKFIAGGNLEDETIDTLIKEAVDDGSSADLDSLRLTIVALFILKEVFSERKNEW